MSSAADIAVAAAATGSTAWGAVSVQTHDTHLAVLIPSVW